VTSPQFLSHFPLFCIEGTIQISDPLWGPEIGVPEAYPRVTYLGTGFFVPAKGRQKLCFPKGLYQIEPKKNALIAALCGLFFVGGPKIKVKPEVDMRAKERGICYKSFFGS
jgi:hypothetical protein